MPTILRDQLTSLGHEIEVDANVDPECARDPAIQNPPVTGSFLHAPDLTRTTIRLPRTATAQDIANARTFMQNAPVFATCPHAAERARRARMQAEGVSLDTFVLIFAFEVFGALSATQRSNIQAALPPGLFTRLQARRDRALAAFNGS